MDVVTVMSREHNSILNLLDRTVFSAQPSLSVPVGVVNVEEPAYSGKYVSLVSFNFASFRFVYV